MKKFLFTAMLLLAIAISAPAQTPTVSTPQSVTMSSTALGMNAVFAATTSPCITNSGQTVHFVFYQATGATGAPTGVQIRVEASFNSDSATCTTGTWFPISDDGTEPTQNGTGEVLGIGNYPFLRVNLVKCAACDANNSITASYTGTSSVPGNPFGLYGAGQQIRKLLIYKQTTGTITSSKTLTPYGSTAGFLVVLGSANFTAGSITARCQDGNAPNVTALTLPTTTATVVIPIAPTPCTLVDARCQACANSGGTISVFWVFFLPGEALPAAAQPPNAVNSEATAAANTAVVTTLTVTTVQRGHLFLVNARCSAGTAQLTVADGATTIFSSAATEVGTTSFTKSWPVGLASSPGNNLVITLGTCGPANTGTLDVQGSVF